MKRLARKRNLWGSCAHCEEPIIKARAVTFNGRLYHPYGCFGKALQAATNAINAALQGLRGGR